MVARVLVVEDDSTVSGVLSAYLRKAGFDPRVAADGATALQEWTQWKPDVVILDVMLPGMTGLWQVSGRADLDFDDLVRLDFIYLERWSVSLDLTILLKTIPAVLGRRGSY